MLLCVALGTEDDEPVRKKTPVRKKKQKDPSPVSVSESVEVAETSPLRPTTGQHSGSSK